LNTQLLFFSIPKYVFVFVFVEHYVVEQGAIFINIIFKFL